MMLDTNGDIFPEGKYTFRVSGVPEAEDIKGYSAWRFTFEAETEESIQTYSERFMVWLLAPLVRALGFPELSPGKFDWEPTQALNRSVLATIKHVTLDKGASAGKTVARMTEIMPISATSPAETKSRKNEAALAAQAPAAADDIPF